MQQILNIIIIYYTCCIYDSIFFGRYSADLKIFNLSTLFGDVFEIMKERPKNLTERLSEEKGTEQVCLRALFAFLFGN